MELAARLMGVFSKASTNRDFSGFYRSNERRIRGTLFALVPEAEVDDLVQQAFLRAWENRAAFQGNSSESTWVTRIAINAAHDYWRKQGGRIHTGLDVIENVADGAAASAIGQVDARMLLRGVLDELTHEHRVVVALFYFQDFTLPEIAETLAEPLGTVKSRLHYAKRQLRERLSALGVEL